MMDEPLIQPRIRKQFPSGYLDRRFLSKRQPTIERLSDEPPLLLPARALSIRQSTFKLLTDEGLLLPPALITTPEVNNKPIADLIRKSLKSDSAPALFTEEKGAIRLDLLDPEHHKQRPSTPRIIRIALLGLLLYLIIGITVFTLTSEKFKGQQTSLKLIDALYYTVVTLCTIGYGDIVPNTPFTKLFTCVFILVGFGFIDVLLNGVVTYVLDMQEEVLLGAVDENMFDKMVRTYIIDKEKGRMRIRTKVGLALGVVIICLAIGTITVHFVEKLTWVDSFYLSVTSVTTVGYGDHAFKTVGGRCFAIIWLLASTFAVAKAFLYLTEFRIDRRNRRMAKEVLHKKLTLGDLVAADMDHDGCISKAEYVIFKLKEMGKITDKDIVQICKQFDNEENAYSGKITVSDLLGDSTEDKTNLQS